MIGYILDVVGGKISHSAGHSRIDLPIEEMTLVE